MAGWTTLRIAGEGIKRAVRAGVRSIEHCSFMDAEAIALMKERGVYLVPTIYIGEYFNATGSTNPGLGKMLELTRKHQAEFERMVGEAIRAGVKIVVGSDFGGYDARLNAREFAAL